MGGMLIDQAISRVRAFRQAKKWTIHRYATEAKLTDSTLRPMDDANWKPSVDTLRALEAVIPPDFTEDAAGHSEGEAAA